MATATVGDRGSFSHASQERILRRDHVNVLTPLALGRGDLQLLLPHAHDADEQIIERLTVTPMASISSETGKKNAKCPEEVTYRGVNLSIACAKGDLPLVAMLMAEGAEQGLDMLEGDKEGNTPLHYAALSENPEVITFLLRKDGRDQVLAGNSRRRWGRRWGRGTLLESRNDACETPLLRAAFGGSVTVARALAEAGADVFATDAAKKTVFHNAARNGRLWVLAYFLWITGEMEMPHRTEAEGCDHEKNEQSGSHGSHGDGNPSTVIGLGGAERMAKMRSPQEDSLLHRKDQDGHTALDWACYAGHVGIARLLVENRLDPRTKDSGGKNSLHWGATKGRAEVCRYLVLLGLDPRQPDAEGADAFELSKNFRSVTQTLLLARTMRKLRGEDRRIPAVPVESIGGSTASAKGSEDADPRTALAGRAPPIEMTPQGSKGWKEEFRISGDLIVPVERLNPTRAWVVGAYSIPMCGVWALSYIVPWWVWSLAVVLMVAGLVKTSMIAGAIVASESGTEPLKSSRGVEAPQRLLLPVSLTLLVAPERHLAIWVGIALCFLVLSISIAIRLLSGGDISSSAPGGWAFAGASIGSSRVAESGTGDGDGEATTAVPAWAAWISVGLWVLTLCLWSRLIAGNGRRAAAKCVVTSAALQKAKAELSAAAPAPDAAPREIADGDGDADVEGQGVRGGEYFEEPLGMRKVMPTGVCPVAGKTEGGDSGGDGEGNGNGERSRPISHRSARRRGVFACRGYGEGRRKRRRRRRREPSKDVNIMGWGDPGAVSMCPREDMYLLVSEVVKGETGMPDSRKLCQTCLVRKPLRSKHCVECGFCVGRMDHHCVWLNNCVGCGNHRVFMAFVLSQLAYAICFLAIATISLMEEMPQEGGACGRTNRLLSKQYFPALLMTVTAAGGVLMLTAIAGYQIWNILANVTTNERLNGRRYPWLKASDASGARFNRYDQGPWGNLMEFLGLTGNEGDEAQGGRRRCPRDYLEGYELPPLDAKQEAKLEALLSKHAARRESDGIAGAGAGAGAGGTSSVVSIVSVESHNDGAQGSSAPNGGCENPTPAGGENRRSTDKAISCPPPRSDRGGGWGGGGCAFGKSVRVDSLKRLSERGGKVKRAGGAMASAGVGVLPVARCPGRSKAREKWSAVGHDNDMDCDADVDVDVGVNCDADAEGARGFALSAPASLYADGAALHRQRGCGSGSDGTTSLPGSGNGYMHCDDNGVAKSPVGAVVAAMRFAPVGAVGCGSLPKIESDVGTDDVQSQHSSFAAVV